MSDTLKARPLQTKVKHHILEQYIKAWGGIILNGLQRQDIREVHFVYVDCNASNGRFLGEQGTAEEEDNPYPVFGSPIIGTQVLDALTQTAQQKQMRLYVNAILIEKERKPYNELQKSLDMAGLSSRVRETDTFTSLHSGDIAIVRADSTSPQMTSKLISYTQSNTLLKYSLYFLDPYGPKAIPFDAVNQIIRAKRHDVIINMPYLYIDRRRNLATQGALTSEEQQRINDLDRMFGGMKWQDIVKKLANQGSTDIELALIEHYLQTLQSADPKLAVKSIRLRFPDKERTMFHLYLTTHDANGALRMNKILREAGYLEHELRWQLRDTQKLSNGQTVMFEIMNETIPPLQSPQQVSIESVAEDIFNRFRGQVLKRIDIYRAMADNIFDDAEITKALRQLRKEKRASFQDPLANATSITFTK